MDTLEGLLVDRIALPYISQLLCCNLDSDSIHQSEISLVDDGPLGE